MEEKIRQCLKKAGLFELPLKITDDLLAFGMDSLVIVLLVLELESVFNLKIPRNLITEQQFKSIADIEKLISSLEVA